MEERSPLATGMSRLLEKEFLLVPRPAPERMFTPGALSRYDQESRFSATLDLSIAVPSDTADIYETNTFYTPLGYQYRFPRIFDYALKWGEQVAYQDYVSTFLKLPMIIADSKYFEEFSFGQRISGWLAYECLTKEVEQFDDWLDESEDLETLSKNLFGSSKPPEDALVAMRDLAMRLGADR
jgi:hypothetical protein